MIEWIKGEQRTLTLRFPNGQTGYAACSQIVVVFTNAQGVTHASFVKVPDTENWPDAELITQSETDEQVIELFFASDVTMAMSGRYTMEIKRVINGEQMPVYKSKKVVLNVSDTKTE